MRVVTRSMVTTKCMELKAVLIALSLARSTIKSMRASEYGLSSCNGTRKVSGVCKLGKEFKAKELRIRCEKACGCST